MFGKLKEENLTLNSQKCEFAMLRITFMGHVQYCQRKVQSLLKRRVRCMKEARKRDSVQMAVPLRDGPKQEKPPQ